jgi:nicotinamide riboside transporter PnuC
MRIFGREPAVLLGLLSAALQMVVAFGLALTPEMTASINAVAAAVIGVITAFTLARDQLYPAIMGLAQAALTLGLAFGYDMSADTTTTIMAFVAALLPALAIRPQVTAPLADDGSRVPSTPMLGSRQP